MAGVRLLRYAIAASFATSLYSNSSPRKLVAHQSSISRRPSTPRCTKRKNHLRPKILKTLIKHHPDSNPELSQYPVIPIDYIETSFRPSPHISLDPPEVDTINHAVIEELETPSDSFQSSFNEVQIGETTQVVEAPEFGLVRFSARDVVKVGVYLIGLFVIQTVSSVLFLGLSNSDDKDRSSLIKDEKLRLHGSDLTGNFRTKDGTVVYIDEVAMEDKIAEIRKMAREARKAEKKMLKESGEDVDDAKGDNKNGVVFEDESSRVRSGVEKEVDGRLTNLRKSLNSAREKLPLLDVNILNKVEVVEKKKQKEREPDAKEEDKFLMFKKKYKFRNGMRMPTEKPKGFQGQAGNGSKRKHVNLDKENPKMRNETAGGKDGERLGRDEDLEDQRSSSHGTNSELLNKDDGNRPQAERGDNSELNPGSQVTKSQIIDEDTAKQSKIIPLKNGGSSISEIGDKSYTESNKELLLTGESDLWWSNLPYVHAILMQKGFQNGLQGFFKLRSPSARNQKQTSYTVTFEDLGDAKNFCYLLESFFDDMPNAKIDIAPLSVKKIKEAVKSQSMRVIVVKKGQLRLYAGQPFSEVQMALRGLME